MLEDENQLLMRNSYKKWEDLGPGLIWIEDKIPNLVFWINNNIDLVIEKSLLLGRASTGWGENRRRSMCLPNTKRQSGWLKHLMLVPARPEVSLSPVSYLSSPLFLPSSKTHFLPQNRILALCEEPSYVQNTWILLVDTNRNLFWKSIMQLLVLCTSILQCNAEDFACFFGQSFLGPKVY